MTRTQRLEMTQKDLNSYIKRVAKRYGFSMSPLPKLKMVGKSVTVEAELVDIMPKTVAT